MQIVYHRDGSKTVLDRKLHGKDEHTALPLAERVLRSYYDLECSQQLKPGKNYNRIKRIWQTDIARREAGLE